MRLVDAEEAYKVLTDYYHHKTEIQHKALKEAIERVPTVDAVEIVRCKDCKFCRTWYFDKDGECPSAICTFWNEDNRVDGIDVHKNGFCSNGERREDGKTD